MTFLLTAATPPTPFEISPTTSRLKFPTVMLDVRRHFLPATPVLACADIPINFPTLDSRITGTRGTFVEWHACRVELRPDIQDNSWSPFYPSSLSSWRCRVVSALTDTWTTRVCPGSGSRLAGWRAISSSFYLTVLPFLSLIIPLIDYDSRGFSEINQEYH